MVKHVNLHLNLTSLPLRDGVRFRRALRDAPRYLRRRVGASNRASNG
jgi:hypothetical protein